MKFEINNKTYEIKEVSQEELQEEQGDINGKYFGLTIPSKQEIWLWKDLKIEQKRQTLLHELFHCYVMNYITTNECNFDEDIWADISANSHNLIHKTADDYFRKEVEKDEQS
jgi:Zn-dependent peptidase ImmA (M78 family)